MPEGYKNGKPDINWWKTQISAGTAYRKKYAYEERWDTWRKYYRGEWRKDILPSNIFFKMVRTIVPRIYFRNPSISLQPTKPGPEHMLFSQLLERIDNKLIKKMKLKKAIKQMVHDGFMFGTGVGKLGYGAEFTPSPEMLNTDQPYDKNGRIVEYNQNVQANMPWFMRVHPGAFIVPHGLMDFDDTRFAVHWIRRPVSDVKDDPRLSNTAHIGPSSHGTSMGTTGTGKKADDLKNPIDMVDLFEIRDKKTQMVFVIAPYVTQDILYEGPDDMQFDSRLPFFTVTFNPDDSAFWGIPDSKILEPIQKELNETRTLMQMHRRLSLVKLLFKKGSITESELSKLLGPDPMAAVEMTGNPLSDIRILEGSNIPADLFNALEATHSDARETVGFSRNQFGEYKPGSGDTTATEAQIVRMASEIRVDERRDMLADMLVEIVESMHKIIFEKWTNEQVVDIMGPGGVPVWIRFKPEVLKQTGYLVNIDPDTSVPETKQAREQKAVQMYSMLREDPLFDPYKLRRYLLHELHGTMWDDMLMVQGQFGTPGSPLDIQGAIQLFQQAGQGGGQGGPGGGR